MINKPIEMIVVANPDGTMQPLRFKIKAEDESDQVIKIEKYQERKQDGLTKGKRIFDCLVVLNESKRIVEIHYDLMSCRWVLFNLK
jgi:hypothetical protein